MADAEGKPSKAPPAKATDETEAGLMIPVRDRPSVLQDFKKAAGPLRGRNRDEDAKP